MLLLEIKPSYYSVANYRSGFLARSVELFHLCFAAEDGIGDRIE